MDLELDHIAIAVSELAPAIATLESLLGGPVSEIERVTDQAVDVAFVGDGPGHIELISPISEDSGVARFLRKRGPGLHHLAFRVADLDATLDRLAARGVRLIDASPRPGAHGRRVAFLHPSAAAGVLIELLET